MHISNMNQKVVRSTPAGADPVAKYLEAHGIAGVELPPDMHRELVRLLGEDEGKGEGNAMGDLPPPDRDPAAAVNASLEHRHEMLAFEMYLAAWIAREGICDRPQTKKKSRRRKR